MNLYKNNKGSVTIELSLFIAIICALIFGYMSVMNGVKTSIALQVAAREGAREYATTGDPSRAKAKANVELAAMGVVGAIPEASVDGNRRIISIKLVYNYTIPLFGTYNTNLKGYCLFNSEPIFAEGG